MSVNTRSVHAADTAWKKTTCPESHTNVANSLEDVLVLAPAASPSADSDLDDPPAAGFSALDAIYDRSWAARVLEGGDGGEGDPVAGLQFQATRDPLLKRKRRSSRALFEGAPREVPPGAPSELY